jgi:hypothetical protein
MRRSELGTGRAAGGEGGQVHATTRGAIDAVYDHYAVHAAAGIVD